MRDTIIEKWENEMESEDLLKLGYVIAGLPKEHYAKADNLNNALEFAIENFAKRHRLSERTEEEMLNCIPVRDAFYKMLEREGWLKEEKLRGKETT